MKNLTVSGQVIDLRSDHLKAVFEYALQQATTSGISVLDFGDNENALDYCEQVDYIYNSLQLLKKLTADGNQDLLIVAADDQVLTRYHRE